MGIFNTMFSAVQNALRQEPEPPPPPPKPEMTTEQMNKLWLGDKPEPTIGTMVRIVTPPPAPPPPVAACIHVIDATRKLLQLREGTRLKVYLDSLGKPTVGTGHLVLPADDLKVGDMISQERADMMLERDTMGAFNAAKSQMAEAGITDKAFLPYLTSVNFQMGLRWTGKFPNTWAMIRRGEYERAALAFNGTIWQQQTPSRVRDFQEALRRLPPKVLGMTP